MEANQMQWWQYKQEEIPQNLTQTMNVMETLPDLLFQ